MSKVMVFSSLSALILSGALASTAMGQAASTDGTAQPSQTIPAAQSQAPLQSGAMNPSDSATYATGKPLEDQSKEGFWGHMNPFARKKWVKRQVDPIKDRTNELDQLQAKNANDIRDVDSPRAGRHQQGDDGRQHRRPARGGRSNRANAANGIATGASTRTDALNGTVSNLDQYQKVTSTDVPFAAGRTALGPKGKADLDDMAAKLER